LANGTTGTLAANEKRKIADVTDGMSNTILVAENAGRRASWILGRMTAASGNGGAWANPANNSGSVAVMQGADPGTGAIWSATGMGTFNCAVNCNNLGEVYSFHSGAANVLLGDGSVRSVSREIDIRIMARLIARNDGMTVPASAFD
jgi:prepilin-type processing-associated H-X9-DG protein